MPRSGMAFDHLIKTREELIKEKHSTSTTMNVWEPDWVPKKNMCEAYQVVPSSISLGSQKMT